MAIHLSASADYMRTGQYIARITGRHPKYTFQRDFIGRKGGKRNDTSTADVDDPGLYECCDIDRKNGKESRFRLVVAVGDQLIAHKIDKDDAMKIAKALDAGRRIEEIIDASVDGWEYQTPRQAEARATAQTIDTAVEACWAVLQSLPEKEAKKALAQLKVRVSPPKSAPAVGLTEEAPVGVVSDANQDAGVPVEQLGLTPTPVATAPSPELLAEQAQAQRQADAERAANDAMFGR